MRWYLIVVAFAALVACDSLDEVLETNRTTLRTTLNERQWKHYTLTVPDNVTSDTEHMIFDVIPVGEHPSDPDIYISEVLLQPSSSL
jgi:hypothetical protein